MGKVLGLDGQPKTTDYLVEYRVLARVSAPDEQAAVAVVNRYTSFGAPIISAIVAVQMGARPMDEEVMQELGIHTGTES